MSDVSVIIDFQNKKYVVLSDVLFMDRQNIQWVNVENYVKKYVEQSNKVVETSDVVYIGKDFPTEIKGSEDTKRLKGTNSKAKANSVINLLDLIRNATNKRWQENYKPKHNVDAEGGWFRFTARFALDGKMYLYDLVNIKKEGEKAEDLKK